MPVKGLYYGETPFAPILPIVFIFVNIPSSVILPEINPTIAPYIKWKIKEPPITTKYS